MAYEATRKGQKKVLSPTFAVEVFAASKRTLTSDDLQLGSDLYMAYKLLKNGQKYDDKLTDENVETVHIAAQIVKSVSEDGERVATRAALDAAASVIGQYCQRREEKFWAEGWAAPGVPRPGFEHLLETLKRR